VPYLASDLDRIGADGLVLFNRFYQPDIDPAQRQLVPTLRCSDSSELLLRLRWIAILAGRVRSSLALTGGAHTPLDAGKAGLAGAGGGQMGSAGMRSGPAALAAGLTRLPRWGRGPPPQPHAPSPAWRGAVSLARNGNPLEYERANCLQVLRSARGSLSIAGH